MMQPMKSGLSFFHPASLLATWFGIGLLPGTKGTYGTIAALPFAWLILDQVGQWALAGASLALFCVGLWASGIYAARAGQHDPQDVVIDEVSGVWLALSVGTASLVHFAIGFALFRLFDGRKPWPVSWGEARPGALGIMLDDLIAGALSAALLLILVTAGV